MNPHQAQASSSKPVRPAGALTPELLGRFKPAKVFTEEALERGAPGSSPAQGASSTSLKPQIISIAFDDTGDRCLTSGEDEGFTLWDAKKGKKLRNFWSKKYGVSLARLTHKAGNSIHSSTKGNDHALRYHSAHDNKYLSYFSGHTGRVRSLHMNPCNDTFLTAGDDGSVRLWDLKSNHCQGVSEDLGGSTIAAFDNTGAIFAAAVADTQYILLYDVSAMDSTAFHFVQLIDVSLSRISEPPPKVDFTSIHISNHGKYLLIGAAGDAHYLFDAFALLPLRKLVGHVGLGKSSGEEVSFTADSRFVVSGSNDGKVYFWDLGTEDLTGPETMERPWVELRPCAVAKSSLDPGPSRCVRFNPRHQMMAVGGNELSFWIPAPDEEALLEEGR